jgi:NhaA family Na+:H+ antiporter
MKLTRFFNEFFNSEKVSGIVLVCCTALSLLLANSFIKESYVQLWQFPIGNHSITYWINDGLMAIFFLLIGLELKREVYIGSLSSLKKASLPIYAAFGGMIIPAAIYILFNFGTLTQSGAGIPMATDIAFAIGILSLLGNRVPLSLKIFLIALAVIDDLGAILVIAIFYTKSLSFINLFFALSIFGVLLFLNRSKVYNLVIYLLAGVLMWYFIKQSGVHPTIAGVLLAFAIPFSTNENKSPSFILQHLLHKPVAFFILPLFAITNTCITIFDGWQKDLGDSSSIGILLGLIAGKPLGILFFSFIAVSLRICTLPNDLNWKKIIGAGILGGIGFTMSIFIAMLSFNDPDLIAQSKIAVLIASLIAGIFGYLWLHFSLKKKNENLVSSSQLS